MSVLRVKNGDQWDIVPAIKGDTGDPAADESITDAMLVPDGIKTEIDWLWGNQLMDIREGELLQTDDAYEAPLVSLDVDGNSTQVVTTGKNLANPNNTPKGFYSWTDGSFTKNDSFFWFSISVTEGDVLRYAGTGLHWSGWLNGEFVDISSLTLNPLTVPSGIDEVRGFYPVNQLSVAIVTKNNSNLTYEPYTGGKPSPSPDYPQEIVDVTDPVAKFARKNLLNPMDIESGYITGNGDSANSQQCRMATKIPVTPGTRYVASFSNSIGYVAYFYANWNDSIRKAASATLSSGTPFAVPSGCNYVRLTFGTPVGTLQDAQLELGSTATAYEPYQGHTVSLLPDGYSLRSLPDGTKDELHLSYLRPSAREGWAWYSREVVTRVGEFLATSPNGWAKSNIAINGYYKNVRLITDRITDRRGKSSVGNGIMSTWFKAANSVNEYKQTINSCWVDSTVNFNIDPDVFSGTALEFGQWVAEHNIEFYMPLATPITTQLDPIELPIMPSKDTTIWSDPSAQLKMTYIQDTNLVIESLEATVADMATS